MRVCVVGLGAIGGLIAARLSRGGVDVSAVARGGTLEAVRGRGGVTLVEDDGEVSCEVAVAADPADLPTPDLVVLCVKAPALVSVAPVVARLLGPRTAVLSATNGIPWWFFSGLPDAGSISLPSLDPDGTLASAIPGDRILGSVLHLAASVPEPGVVVPGYERNVIVGEPRGRDVDGRAEVAADVLRAGGFRVEVSDRIQRDVWFKLWGNMTMNPLSAVTGATLDRILAEPQLRQFASRCMREAATIGERIGLPIDVDPEDRHEITAGLGAVRTSMLQDVDAGRPVELDALVTAVVEIGHQVDVPTPDLDTLLGLARLHARVRGLYPG